MAHGEIPRLLYFLGVLWSGLLSIIRPMVMLFSSKFRERELEVAHQRNAFVRKGEQLSVWIHASSLGEFEQARPILEGIKLKNPEIDITVTFFSPSGFRIRNTYEYANRVLYLPLDTMRGARDFLEMINPDIIIFIRYELWLNHLIEARRNAIPVYAVNATFPRSALWNMFPGILSSILKLFSEIYTVDSHETNQFVSLGVDIPIHTGTDTRIDRIHQQVSSMKNSYAFIHDILPGFEKASIPCIVLGSSWEEDESMFLQALPLIKSPIRLIIVPHEPTPEHCLRLSTTVPNSILLSECEEIGDEHIIVDSIGRLLGLYGIADAAYIGGGFGAGVHSCAEPAGYGIPLASGPDISRSPDAKTLHELGALELLRNAEDALAWMNAIAAGVMTKAGEQAKEYIETRRGMTNTVLKEIIGLDD